MCFLNSFLLILTISFIDVSLFPLVKGQGVPSTPCPDVFEYFQLPNGDIYGRISIPNDGSNSLSLGVNASMRGYYTDNGKVSLKLKLNTRGQELIEQRAKILSYSVFFPFQHAIPKITYIELNNRGYCRGPPEALVPGSPGVTSLWAGHKYYFQSASGHGESGPSNSMYPVEEIGLPVRPDERFPEVEFSSPSSNQPIDNSVEPANPSRNQNQACGVAKNMVIPLILGGAEIADGTFPWLAAMFTTKGTGYEYKCTANLVSEKHVITAARCVNYYKVQIVQAEEMLFVFGKSNLQKWATNGAVTRGAIKIQTHPDFNQTSGHGDLSIVTLDRPMPFSNTIAPICLWSGNSDLTDIVDKTGTIAGWGTDEKAQKAGRYSVSVAKSLDMPVVSQEKCLYSNLTYYSLTSDMTFCAGQRDGTGTCVGDSGAGFMMNKKGKYYLRGLASLLLKDSSDNCDLSYYMIFCDVAKFSDWIRNIMNE